MKMLRNHWWIFGLVVGNICAGAAVCQAQNHVFLPSNLSRIRALGMAGAVNALEDDLGAISYNPAAYSLYQDLKRFRITLFFSPLTPFLISNRSEEYFGEVVSDNRKIPAAVFSFIKGFNITYSGLDLGFLFSEPRLKPIAVYDTLSTLHLQNVYKNQYHSMIARLRLAQQLAIGATLHLLYFEDPPGERSWKFGTSYGVFLKPHEYIQVGISFFSFPEQTRSFRTELEEIHSDAINMGVSLVTPWHFRLEFDMRNLARGQDGPREQYLLGAEQAIFSQIALRGGAQYDPESNALTYTAGVGLLNMSRLVHSRNSFDHEDFALNYAIVRKESMGQEYFLHAFSFIIRL